MASKAFYIIDSEAKRLAAAEFVSRLRATPVMCVEVKEYKQNRSNSQNRLMWMWLTEVAAHTGNTPEELHEILKVRFLGIESRMIEGQVIVQPKSTTSLTTKEMGEHLLKIEALARSMEIKLPYPDDAMNAIYGERIK